MPMLPKLLKFFQIPSKIFRVTAVELKSLPFPCWPLPPTGQIMPIAAPGGRVE
jgi:hypothetical protein